MRQIDVLLESLSDMRTNRALLPVAELAEVVVNRMTDVGMKGAAGKSPVQSVSHNINTAYTKNAGRFTKLGWKRVNIDRTMYMVNTKRLNLKVK